MTPARRCSFLRLAVCGTLAVELILGHFTHGRRGIVLHFPFSVVCVAGIFLTTASTAYYSTLSGAAEGGLNEKTHLLPDARPE